MAAICLGLNVLTGAEQNGHLSQTIFPKVFLSPKMSILFKISRMFGHRNAIDNKSVFVHVMVWSWTGNSPLPEPISTYI